MERKYTAGISGAASRYRTTAVPVLASLAICCSLLLALLNLSMAMDNRFGTFAQDVGRRIHVSTVPGSTVLPLMFGVFLLFLTYELWLRKRAALVAISAFLMIQGAVDIWRGMGIVAGAVSFFIGIILLSAGREFPARPDPASFKKFKLMAPLLLSAFLGFGVGGLFLLRNGLHISSNPYALAHRALAVAVGESGLAFHGWAILYRDALIILVLLGAVYLVVLLFRPYRENVYQPPEDRDRAIRLVKRYGSDSLSYFNTRRDKNLFFLDDRMFLAYRTEGGVAVVSGDPVGPLPLVPEIMLKFREYCDERGWRLTVLGASDDCVESYHSAGLKSFGLGEEAIIDCERFTLEGRDVRKLRQSVSKLDKAGITCEFMYNAGIPAHVRHELEQISADWRGGKPETGFSMGLGRLMQDEDPDCLLSVAYDADMNPVGFLYMVPMYPHEGYSLDITRSMIGAPNSLSEYMLARTALFLKEEGYKHLSLHFLALSQHYRDDLEKAGNRLMVAMAKFLDRIFPVITVYRFDKKFFPRWNKRYLVYESPLDFPRIGYSAISVENALDVSTKSDREKLGRVRRALSNGSRNGSH